jgi:F0F1-type ATP synthase epsilon subunit
MEIDMTLSAQLSNLAPLADAYALLKDQETKIKARVEEARKEILSTGATEIDGEVCTVIVDTKKGAKTIDKEAVIKLLLELGATADQVEGCFKYGAETKSLRVKANLKAVA